jgi:alpha-1,6-mannosyltransferase
MDDNLAAHLPDLPSTHAIARAFLGRAYIGLFDAHLANSNYTAEELREAMVAPHLRPIYVTPMGVEIPRPLTGERRHAIRRAIRERLGIRPDARLVLYAGRLSPEKHVSTLVAVAARLAWRNRYLVVAGDGPLRDALAADCARHAPAVARFIGHVGREQLQELLAAADVFVHPNPREPFGIAPLEAMAAGLPVVLPRAGGVLTYATDGNAWLVRPDAVALADGVDAALTASAECAARASAARRTAESFAWPAAASAMLKGYEAIHRARLEARQALAKDAGLVTAVGALFGAGQ